MEEKQIITLVPQKDTWCKLIIPEEVERKIRLLCREIHNIEWSGILFYEVSGSFENKDLVVTCKDIYQMDIGNGSYTEYTIPPDVASYMLEHDLMGCYQGHIHSHHQMSTFFSGTDTQELRDGGNDTNHFVSLIVNNARTYTAGITRRIDAKKTIREEFSYKSFNDVEHSGVKEYITEDSYLEWYKMQIEIQGRNNSFEDEMLARIKEIKEEKSKKTTYENKYSGYSLPVKEEHQYPKMQTSFTTTASKGNQIQKELPFEEESEIPYGRVKLDKNLVNTVLKQLVTCSIIIPSSSTIDLERWSKSVPKLYADRFVNIKIFKEFAEPYIDFLLNYTDYTEAPETLDLTEITCILAYELQSELRKLPKNIWLDTYIEILEDYIL